MLNNQIKTEQNNSNEKKSILEQDFENYKITANKMNQELIQQNNELKGKLMIYLYNNKKLRNLKITVKIRKLKRTN